VDLDNPEKFTLLKKTLTVQTRNGSIHKYYSNSGDIKNSVGKNSLAKCGEVRAEWQYVLAPGSYVPKDLDAPKHATGLYQIVEETQLTTLYLNDLPEDFKPTVNTTIVSPDVLTKTVSQRNKFGWSLEEIRNRDQKLNSLLDGKTLEFPSPSEADMSTLTKLLFWEYTEAEAVSILRNCRYRKKFDRPDYILNILKKISIKSKISDTVNPKIWTPKKKSFKEGTEQKKGKKEDLSVQIGDYTLTKKGKKLILKDENEKVCHITPYFKLLTEKYKQNLIAHTNVTDLRIIEEKTAELDLKVMKNQEKEETVTSEQTRKTVIKKINGENKVFCNREDFRNLPVYIWTDQKKWEEKLRALIYKTHFEIYGTEEPESSAKSIYEYYQGKGQYTIVLPKPPYLVPFQNGYYNLKTGKLEPLTSEYFTVNVSPYNFIDNPQLPKWQKFQKEIHHKEDIDFITEFFAYCLYTSYARPMFLILIGNGQNGKSVELEVIIEVLGTDNVSTVSLQQLVYSPYGAAEPYQKLAIIADDITNTKIKRTGILKALSSGSKITARRMFGHPFDYKNYAKPVFSCNEPPEIEDDTDSLWIRLKFVEYPNKFAENPSSPNEKQAKEKHKFVQELLEEKEHIASFLAKKLAELYKNKFKFSYNKSTNEVREYYRKKSNPVICWIEDCLNYTGLETDYVLKTEVYPHFRKWCEINNIKAIPSGRTFFTTLKNEGILPIQKASLDRKRVYEGYELVAASQDKNSIDSGKNTLHSIVFDSKKVNSKCTCDVVTIPVTKHLAGSPCQDCKSIFAKEYSFTLPENPVFKSEDYDICQGCFDGMKEKLKPALDLVVELPQEEVF
jgi:P4 family phage/plasmid primase-like protien